MKLVKVKFTIEYIVASVRSSIELLREIGNKDITTDIAKEILSENLERFFEFYKTDTNALHNMLSEIRSTDNLKELVKSTISQPLDLFANDFPYYLENGYISFEIVDLKIVKSGDYVLIPSVQWGLASLQTLNHLRKLGNLLNESEKTEKSKEIFNAIFTGYIENHEMFLEELTSLYPTEINKTELYTFTSNTFEQIIGSNEIQGNHHNYLLGGIKSKCWTLDKFKVS